MSHYDESPVNPLPFVVVLLAGSIFCVEAVLQLAERGIIGGPAGIGWRSQALRDYAFFSDYFHQMWAQNYWPLEHVQRIVTYAFVHVSFVQTVFVIVFILALGKMVAEVFAAWAVLVVFFGAVIGAGLFYWLVLPGNHGLVGGFPGAYGLIGAYTFLYWLRQVATGGQQHQAFMMIAFLMGIQLLFSLVFQSGIDWVADLVGFACGFGLSFLVNPAGWTRLTQWLRSR